MVSPRMRLLRGLSGRVLPCGCLVGVYETYNRGVVATVDARGQECHRPDHRYHAVVDLQHEGVAPYQAPEGGGLQKNSQVR